MHHRQMAQIIITDLDVKLMTLGSFNHLGSLTVDSQVPMCATPRLDCSSQ